jgi:hypothetical protein
MTDSNDLLDVLLPNMAQTQSNVLNRASCEAYVGQLTSFSVDRLAKEPALLEAESVKIKGWQRLL